MVGLVLFQSVIRFLTDRHDEKHVIVHLQGEGKVQKDPLVLKIANDVTVYRHSKFYLCSFGLCSLPNYKTGVFFLLFFTKHYPPNSNNNIIHLNSA